MVITKAALSGGQSADGHSSEKRTRQKNGPEQAGNSACTGKQGPMPESPIAGMPTTAQMTGVSNKTSITLKPGGPLGP